VVGLAAGDLFSLRGKTVLLTGATGFLGRTFARAVLENDGKLVALSRPARLTTQVDEWRAEFGDTRVCGYSVDMYDHVAFDGVLREISDREGFIEVLINNAHELGPRTGFNTPDGGLENATYDQWMRNLTAGVYWAAAAVQQLGPAMKERRRGSIVNIATMYGLVAPSPSLYEGTPFMNPPGYSAAKAGLLAFTRYVASFWGPHGVRANAIVPGPFSNTGGDSENAVPSDDPFLERLRQRTCLGRVGSPNELAGALLFLSSDASSFVTGQALVVDGGWTVT
jgi:gluconate 5-dehydrogenase